MTHDDTSDSKLVVLAQKGDQDALRDLLRRSGPAVRERIAGRISSRWRALISPDDVMQQAYAEAVFNLPRFTDTEDGSFQGWLNRIAMCNLQDAIKALEAEKRGGGRQRMTSIVGEDGRVTLLRLLSSGGTAPEAAVSRDEAARLVDEAINRLPSVYQTVVRGIDLDGRPVAHLAEELGRSVGAVHMLRARAHDRLRVELGGPARFFTNPP